MKFEHIKIPDDKNIVIMLRKTIFKKLEKIHKNHMKKRGSSYCYDAVYRDMETRCIIHSNKTHDLIFKDRFNKMIKEYKTKIINWPGDFSVEEFNPLAHLLLSGEIPEC